MPQYEVWCHSCNVTFPPEQKRCLHCGGRLRGGDGPGRGMRSGRKAELMSVSPVTFEHEMSTASAVPDLPVSGAALEPEEEPVRRSFLRAGMTIVWMVLLAAGYAWRACSQ